jgi:hypothetical protein
MEKTFNSILEDFEHGLSPKTVISFVCKFLKVRHMEMTANRISRMREDRAISHIYSLAGREEKTA